MAVARERSERGGDSQPTETVQQQCILPPQRPPPLLPSSSTETLRRAIKSFHNFEANYFTFGRSNQFKIFPRLFIKALVTFW
jgi:hypothetical protein